MIMSTKSVLQALTRLLLVAFLLLFLAAWIASVSASPAVGGRRLFLLAGTPTVQSPVTYPVDLYYVAPNRTLALVRQIVPQSAGLFTVLDDEGNNIYVAYPHINPTTLSIVHKERPALKDTIIFNPGGLAVDNTAVGVAAGKGFQSYALFPLLRRTGGDSSPIHVDLTSVAGDAAGDEPRIKINEWSQYQSFRMRGAPGGPLGPGFTTLGEIRNNYVELQLSVPGRPPFLGQPSDSELELASAPPDVPVAERSGPFYIAVANRGFLAIGSTPGHPSLYVYDRLQKTWKLIDSTSTIQYARRIFGSWLATIVEVWRPGNPQNPGREDERDTGTRLLTNIREAYAFWAGRDVHIPGILVLDNLEDGRRITLQTNEEDSEILDVRSDGLVLYRVNDLIFSAQIEGDKLSAPTLVVKDDDVPEIHWAFWSNAQGETNIKPKITLPAAPLGNR